MTTATTTQGASICNTADLQKAVTAKEQCSDTVNVDICVENDKKAICFSAAKMCK